jgi:hypothetical protein
VLCYCDYDCHGDCPLQVSAPKCLMLYAFSITQNINGWDSIILMKKERHEVFL